MMYTFTIEGRIKPYVRMTQRSKWANPQAQEYLCSQDAIRVQLRQQMVENGWEMLDGQTPLSVSLVFTFPGGWHNMDLSNLIKACEDSANNLVWPDDRWIDNLHAARKAGDDYVCTMRVVVM